jgi:hypothetical protein
MLRVVGNFSQTYMPLNFPWIVCAVALIETKYPRASAVALSRLFRIEELHEDLAAPNCIQPNNIRRSTRVPAKALNIWRVIL